MTAQKSTKRMKGGNIYMFFKNRVLLRNPLVFELGSPWCRNVFGAGDNLGL